MIQEWSKLTDIEILLQNMLPVGSVMEEDVSSSEPLPESLEGCFSCGTNVGYWMSRFRSCRWGGRRTELVTSSF